MSEPVLRVFVKGHPVSVNSAYGTARRGQRYLTKDANAWKETVGYETLRALGTNRRPHGEVEVHCTFYGCGRADADNLAKFTLDGLRDALKLDDKFFNPVTMAKARRIKGEPPQGALIEIWERHDGKPKPAAAAANGAKLLTVPQAAAVLATSPRTLYRRLMRGEIPSFKIGSQRRLSVAALDLWIEQQQLIGA